VENELAQVALFRGISADAVSEFSKLGKREAVGSGQTLFQLGDIATRFYILVDGSIALTMPIDIRGSRQDAFIEEVTPAGIFGWSALVQPHRYTMSAKATVDSEVRVFESSAVFQLLDRQPALGTAFYKNVTELICHRLHRVQAMWLRELQRTVNAKLW